MIFWRLKKYKTYFYSLGAVVNNLTCVCILFATEKEHISGVNITVHVTDLLFYVAMVSFMNLMNRESFHENPLVRSVSFFGQEIQS